MGRPILRGFDVVLGKGDEGPYTTARLMEMRTIRIAIFPAKEVV